MNFLWKGSEYFSGDVFNLIINFEFIIFDIRVEKKFD